MLIKDILADGLTKALTKYVFCLYRGQLGLVIVTAGGYAETLKKQRTVSTLIIEAEYIILGHAAREVI